VPVPRCHASNGSPLCSRRHLAAATPLTPRHALILLLCVC
jgi:hypothetical protein